MELSERDKSCVRYFKSSCFAHTLQKVRSKKTNKKQFKILEKDKYVTPDQIFEAFWGISDDLTINDDEKFLLNVQRCRHTNVACYDLSLVI